MLFVSLIMAILLTAVAYQDFKFRGVYWWLFALLLLSSGLVAVVKTNFLTVLEHALYNSIFISLQLFLLSLYFSIKQGKFTNIFKGYFGLGDLCFLISITVYLSFLNYVLYYMISLLSVILFTWVLQVVNKAGQGKIPLAGYQAIILLGLMLMDFYSIRLDLLNDSSVVDYFGL